MVLKFPTSGSIGEYISMVLNHKVCVNFLKQETKIQGLRWHRGKKKAELNQQWPDNLLNTVEEPGYMTGKKSNAVALIHSELNLTYNI